MDENCLLTSHELYLNVLMLHFFREMLTIFLKKLAFFFKEYFKNKIQNLRNFFLLI